MKKFTKNQIATLTNVATDAHLEEIISIVSECLVEAKAVGDEKGFKGAKANLLLVRKIQHGRMSA